MQRTPLQQNKPNGHQDCLFVKLMHWPLWELPQARKWRKLRAVEGRRERDDYGESGNEKENLVCQGAQNKMPPESFSIRAYLAVHAAAVPTQDQREGGRSREPCALQAAAVLQSAK